MEDEDIIKNFIEHGCYTSNGASLPLENCAKIHKLYKNEIDRAFCAPCQLKSINHKYEARLKIFLKKKREEQAHMQQSPVLPKT